MLKNPTYIDAPTYTPQSYAEQNFQYRHSRLHILITCWPTHPVQTIPPIHHNYMLTEPFKYRHSHLHTTITCWPNHPVQTLPPTHHNYILIKPFMFRHSHIHTTIKCRTNHPVQTLPNTKFNYMLNNACKYSTPTYTPQLHSDQHIQYRPFSYTQLHADQPMQYRPSHVHTMITCWPNHPVQTLPPTHDNYMLTNPSTTDPPTYTQLHADQTMQYRLSHLHTPITCWPNHPVQTLPLTHNYMPTKPCNTDSPTYTHTITCWPYHPVQTLPLTHHNYMLTNPTSTDPRTYTSLLHAH